MTRVGLAYRFVRVAALAVIAMALAACGQTDGGGIAPAALPLSKDAMHLMSQKGMNAGAPIGAEPFRAPLVPVNSTSVAIAPDGVILKTVPKSFAPPACVVP